MSYKVETSSDEHEAVLRDAIHNWTKQDYDVHLVSKEGHRIFSHKILLSFYSSHLREIFNETVVAFSSEPVNISLPSSSSASITSMLKMLVTGKSNTSQRSGLREMKETARILGIDLNNCHFDNGNASSSVLKIQNHNLPQKSEFKDVNVPPGITIQKATRKFSRQENIPETEILLNEETPASDDDLSQDINEDKLNEEQMDKNVNKCDICQTTYKERAYLLKHKRITHGLKTKRNKRLGLNNEPKCEACGSFFKKRKYLLNHIRIKHGGLKLYEKTLLETSEDKSNLGLDTLIKEEIHEDDDNVNNKTVKELMKMNISDLYQHIASAASESE